VAIAAAGVYAWKEYSRDVQGSATMSTVATISAPDLLNAFQEDEDRATATYVGKTEQAIEVTGVIRSVEDAGEGKVNVALETGDPLAAVLCELPLTAVPKEWSPGMMVRVKGICKGMLMDVLLVRCSLVE
jgi:hypothetical protein